MSEKVNIFGVEFDTLTAHDIAEIMADRITGETPDESLPPITVFTPNPEIVMYARKDKRLLAALKKADIVCADGIGIVWASKYFGKKIKERASGYDVVMELFRMSGKKGGVSAFFYGGSQEAVTEAAAKMELKYKGLSIAGVKNGYDNDDAVQTINESGAQLLLVGLGSPKQEFWVIDNLYKLNVRVVMVVGGSFDVMSGRLKRAPEIMRKLGLEWLYRLIKQPKRLFRMLQLPLFVLTVLFERGKKQSKKEL